MIFKIFFIFLICSCALSCTYQYTTRILYIYIVYCFLIKCFEQILCIAPYLANSVQCLKTWCHIIWNITDLMHFPPLNSAECNFFSKECVTLRLASVTGHRVRMMILTGSEKGMAPSLEEPVHHMITPRRVSMVSSLSLYWSSTIQFCLVCYDVIRWHTNRI